MNNLVEVRDNQIVVSSRQIAKNFNKMHKHVLTAIKNLVSSAEKSSQWFKESSYKDISGKTNIEYLVNRDGFTLLAMGFTGKEALQWKLKYIAAFNEMEEKLRNLPKQQTLIEEPDKPTLKYYKGMPVITVHDFAKIANILTTTVHFLIKEKCRLIKDKEYYLLKNEDVVKFKAENPGKIAVTVSAIVVITAEGVKKLCRELKGISCTGLFKTAAPIIKKPLTVQAEDVRIPEEMRKQLEKIRKQINALDVMVNNALRNWARSTNEIEGYKAAIWDAYITMMPSVNALEK